MKPIFAYFRSIMTSPQDPVDTEEPLIDRHDQGSEVATTLGGPEARGTAESMDNAAKETIDEPERAEDEDLSKQAPTPSAGSLSWAQTAAKVKDPLPVRDNEQVKEDQRIAVERTLRTEIDRLRNDLTVTEQRLTEEQARRKDESRHSARQVGDLSYRFNQCKADLNSKNGRIRQLEQENRNLETENQKLQKTQREEENKSTQLESKNKGLQEQVKNLSRDIAAQGSGDGQIADSELEKRVKQIVCDVQDWAMNGFRKSKPGTVPAVRFGRSN